MARSLRFLISSMLGLAIVILAATSSAQPGSATSATTFTTPYESPSGGESGHQSMVLDAAGNPVISYIDRFPGELLILHCNDQNCDGIGDSLTRPADAHISIATKVRAQTSIALDASGNPVVAYSTWGGSNALRLLHCDDPNCDGTGESVTSPVVGNNRGYVSLVLDAVGNPVISYISAGPPFALNILHCDDPNCDGVGESITSPDDANGGHTSIVLDSSGNPVVSYLYASGVSPNAVKIMHCNDPDCAGGDESFGAQVIPNGSGFSTTSLVLDGSGYPVVSYAHEGVWLLRCDDPNCDGAGETLASIDVSGIGKGTSLVLDDTNNPIVSYSIRGPNKSQIAYCANPTCSAGSSIVVLDATFFNANVGDGGTSMALDALGNPVVSIDDRHELKIAHCWEATCGNVDSDGDGCFDIRELHGANDVAYGGARDPKNPWDFYDVAGGGGGPPDQVIDLSNDILGVVLHYAPTGLEPEYDVDFDRGPQDGPNAWNMTAPDGVIDLANDILGVIQQYLHSCQ